MKAAENNFRGDSKSQVDTQVRHWSQCLLHSLRMQMTVYNLLLEGKDALSVQNLLQQNFQLTTELLVKFNNFRRERSLPGSVPSGDELLFDKKSDCQGVSTR